MRIKEDINKGKQLLEKLNLTREDVNKKAQILLDLKYKTDTLTRIDIANWHKAWQMAINTEEPKRGALYDVYTTALIDLHLTGAIEQRKAQTIHRSFVVYDAKGEENEELGKLFQKSWFDDFLNLALDSLFWGHSLIQMSDVVGTGEEMRFSSVELVPRKHVIQEYGVITREAGDDAKKGIYYRDEKWAKFLVEVGTSRELGLLLKIAPHCISKKNMLSYWDTFGEIFGMPIRVGKTPSQNRSDWNTMRSMLENMGAAAWALIPEGSEIDVKETTRGDAYNVYDKRIDRANSEISKGVLNQTMTIDNGSSHSQSETHLEILKKVGEKDSKFIKNLINDKLIPLMTLNGFPLEGCKFDWDNSLSFTPEQQRENERLMLQYFDIDPEYFKKKYKIDIIGVKGQQGENDFFE